MVGNRQETRVVPAGREASMAVLLAWNIRKELVAQGSWEVLTVQGARVVPVGQGAREVQE